jgi:hypothetical protein
LEPSIVKATIVACFMTLISRWHERNVLDVMEWNGETRIQFPIVKIIFVNILT